LSHLVEIWSRLKRLRIRYSGKFS